MTYHILKRNTTLVKMRKFTDNYIVFAYWVLLVNYKRRVLLFPGFNNGLLNNVSVIRTLHAFPRFPFLTFYCGYRKWENVLFISFLSQLSSIFVK